MTDYWIAAARATRIRAVCVTYCASFGPDKGPPLKPGRIIKFSRSHGSIDVACLSVSSDYGQVSVVKLSDEVVIRIGYEKLARTCHEPRGMLQRVELVRRVGVEGVGHWPLGKYNPGAFRMTQPRQQRQDNCN